MMPTALEAGTLNVHGIAGLGASMDYILQTGTDKIFEKEMRCPGVCPRHTGFAGYSYLWRSGIRASNGYCFLKYR